MPAPKFILKRSSSGKFMFTLHAANGQVILTSQMYGQRRAAANGVKSVKSNCKRDACFERRKSRDGLGYFVLKSTNGEVIGTSQRYRSSSGLRNGIASVKKNGGPAKVEDQT